MNRKVWVYRPQKIKKIVSETAKCEIASMCDAFIESELQPMFVKRFNPHNKKKQQLVDIYCRWRGAYVYFIGVYKDLRPKVYLSEYEEKLARFEYINKNCFCLSYVRHTGAWQDITHGHGMSLLETLKCIKEMPHFAPIL